MASDNRSRKRRKRRADAPGAVDVVPTDGAPDSPTLAAPERDDDEIGLTPRKPGAVNVVVVAVVLGLLVLALLGLLLLTKAA
jgi:hypothetical protein